MQKRFVHGRSQRYLLTDRHRCVCVLPKTFQYRHFLVDIHISRPLIAQSTDVATPEFSRN